jgi:CubicO group peptidase (beta-lactamase class C family)
MPSLAQYNFAPVDAAIAEAHRSLGKNFVALVYKDGKVIYKKESGDFKTETQEPIASCSKWLTAALVMTFIEEGKLGLDDKVSTYLPAFAVNGKDNITIRQCLSQQTGIHQEPVKLFKLVTQKKYKTLGEQVNDFTKKDMDFPSGTGFYYGTVGLNIAARVVEVIAKKDFETLLQTRILLPLDMNRTTFSNGNHAPNPSGGARSTPNDYMNFLIMLLNKGEFKGKRILSETSISLMEQAQTTLDKIKYTPKVAEGFNYAMGCWAQETNSKGTPTVLSCPGLFGTWPLVDTCREYACLFFVKSLLSEQKTDAYLRIKKAIDTVIPLKCKP